jgi:hypothetical protein
MKIGEPYVNLSSNTIKVRVIASCIQYYDSCKHLHNAIPSLELMYLPFDSPNEHHNCSSGGGNGRRGGGGGGDPKLCGACGDVAKSNHFGGRSCDSCKAFFRRSVQNNAYKGFACPYEKKCVIAKASRKACQYCR